MKEQKAPIWHYGRMLCSYLFTRNAPSIFTLIPTILWASLSRILPTVNTWTKRSDNCEGHHLLRKCGAGIISSTIAYQTACLCNTEQTSFSVSSQEAHQATQYNSFHSYRGCLLGVWRNVFIHNTITGAFHPNESLPHYISHAISHFGENNVKLWSLRIVQICFKISAFYFSKE